MGTGKKHSSSWGVWDLLRSYVLQHCFARMAERANFPLCFRHPEQRISESSFQTERCTEKVHHRFNVPRFYESEHCLQGLAQPLCARRIPRFATSAQKRLPIGDFVFRKQGNETFSATRSQSTRRLANRLKFSAEWSV